MTLEIQVLAWDRHKTTNNNFSLVLIIAFTGKQSYYNGQYMYLFTQQLYIINRSKVTKKCMTHMGTKNGKN
jgi:hypothetical protein